MYTRVIPRDLFNESKLLKCIGQLALIAHDGRDCRGRHVNGLRVDYYSAFYTDGGPFISGQDPSSGGLYLSNVAVWCGDSPVYVKTIYNSKSPYPLLFEGDDGDGSVFNDDGSLDDLFLEFLEAKSCSTSKES